MTDKSPLDEALLAVHEAEGATEDVKNGIEDQYYELFLNTELYIPTWNLPEESDGKTEDDEITIQPVIIEDESAQNDEGSENKTYIMIFDSEDRLNEWADGQKVGIVELSGHDVVNILGSANYIILNPSSECSKEFYPEEIEWLKSSIVDDVED